MRLTSTPRARRRLSMALAAFTAAFASAWPALADIALATHRAVYDLKLKHAADRAALASVEGRIAYEITGSSCDGWTINSRIVNAFRPAEGDPRLVDTRSAAYESDDGHSLRFSQTEFVDNKLDNEKKLKAERGEEGGKGKLELPTPTDFALPPGTIFPVAHMKRLIQAALKGETRDASLVFDGSDGEKTYKAITLIGKKIDGATGHMAIKDGDAASLARMPAWPVTISYYDLAGGQEGTPAYTISYEMFENGVAGTLSLDYGDFALDGTLANFKLLEQPGCN
jgi:EipB-like